MSDWVRVCERAELLPGEYRVVDVDGVAAAVFNLDGELYAIEDVCTHDGGELTGGSLNGHEIECPRHGARFDIRDFHDVVLKNGAVALPILEELVDDYIAAKKGA